MQKITILLIEDDESIADLYEESFSDEDVTVRVAKNGKEGIVALKQGIPDIILLDILMPEMNGFEFLKEIKKEREYREIPVLLLTNLGEEKIDMDSELVFALGIHGYLIKAKNTPGQVLERIYKILKK